MRLAIIRHVSVEIYLPNVSGSAEKWSKHGHNLICASKKSVIFSCMKPTFLQRRYLEIYGIAAECISKHGQYGA
jgi:hypothetical protein